jgi:hypothetical protein
MKFSYKELSILNGILLAVLLVHSIYRDLILDNLYPADLRNRVVGARLEKDGKLPYTYQWQPADGMRYYDMEGQNQKPSGVNYITASPFFHKLLYPVCDLPQRTISKIWLWLQYLFLTLMIVMTCSLTQDKIIRWIIINVGILFTATEAWKLLIANGQNYLFVAFLICCIITGLVKNKLPGIILAAVFAAVLILTRPIAIVVFIPLLFYYKKYLLYLGVSFTLLGLYIIFVLTSSKEKALYKNYFYALHVHVKDHQEDDLENQPAITPKTLYYNGVVGFYFDEIHRLSIEHPIKIYSENGNIFVLYHKLTRANMSLSLSNGLAILSILILTISFVIFHRSFPPKSLQIILFGFTLYMIVDFFVPIYRHQYYTIQWLPLILVSFLLLPDWKNIVFVLLITGLLLNICNFSWLPMRHTLGEFCWLAGLILLVFSSRLKQVA